MRKLECPGCGANLELKEDNRDFAFCEYCGAKITFDDFRSTHHYVDEARLVEAETEQMVKKKQIEWAEKQEQENKEKRSLKIKLTIIFVAVCLVSFLIAIPTNSLFFYSLAGISMLVGMFVLESDYFDLNKDISNPISDVGKIRVPDEISGYWNKNYIVIKSMFKKASFTNINCVPLNDLTTGLLVKPGTVSSITIDGTSVTSGGAAFLPGAEVIITYHSMSEQNAGSIIAKAGQKIKEQFSDEEPDENHKIINEKKTSQTTLAFRTQNYKETKKMLTGAGFTNVLCVPLNDLTDTSSSKNNMVESVTSKGIEFDLSQNHAPHDPIIITYHSVP